MTSRSSNTGLVLTIDKPAAGGRMLARHEGLVVLVAGAIPGERVLADVERVQKGVAYAHVVDVLSASPDRRQPAADPRCGGHAYAHIRYDRQLELKAAIVQDAFARIGRLPLASPPPVESSPQSGYRMRARLHARGGRLGFYREGTHELCDAVSTGQLSEATSSWIAAAEETIRRGRLEGLTGLDVAENVAGDQRACHLELARGARVEPFSALGDRLTGLSASRPDRPAVVTLSGTPTVTDELLARPDDESTRYRVSRDVRAFFQGNRYLLQRLVAHVMSWVHDGPIVDLYAGVGLFGLAASAAGAEHVQLVEADPVAGASLRTNAAPFGQRVTISTMAVERFLAESPSLASHAVIVDPPRTGLSREAVAGLLRASPRTLAYVSCDPATLARDARLLVDAGYGVRQVDAFDLFPNSAHVEAVVVFDR